MLLSVDVPFQTLANLPKKDSKYCFSFDRVFGPSSSQEIVFDDISQLVQVSQLPYSYHLGVPPGLESL